MDNAGFKAEMTRAFGDLKAWLQEMVQAPAPKEGGEPEGGKDMADKQEGERKFMEIPDAQLMQLVTLLGLGEGASFDDGLKAGQGMAQAQQQTQQQPPQQQQPMNGGGMGNGMNGQGGQRMGMSAEQEATLAALQKQVADQQGYISKLERERTIASYARRASSWTAIAGKPDELAVELADLHEKAGAEVAERVAASYQKAHDAAAQAGATQSYGRARAANLANGEANADPFEKAVSDYAAANKVSQSQALLAMQQQNPTEFAAFSKRRKALQFAGREA